MRRKVYAILLVPPLVACTSTTTVPVSSIRPGVVHDHEGDEVRIDPNSEVRFERTDGAWTDWYSASDLKVNDDGVIFPTEEGMRWSDVKSAEVKNLSGGKTLVGVVAVSAVAVGLVAVALIARKAPELPLKIAGEAVVHTVVRLPHVRFSGSGSASSSGDDGPSSPTAPAFEAPVSNDAHSMFDAHARRRAAVRFGAAADYGATILQPNAWTASGVGILRFTDLFEIGGGVRLLRGDRVYFGRAGLHAELDARQLFALPFSIDMGGSSTVAFHARLNFGLRVRILDGLYLGIHPLNPAYTRLRDPNPMAPRWSFPSTVETSFTF
jgi:hypothetical protein